MCPPTTCKSRVFNDPAENPGFSANSPNAPGQTLREGTLALPYDAFVTFALCFFNVITKTVGRGHDPAETFRLLH